MRKMQKGKINSIIVIGRMQINYMGMSELVDC